MAQGKHRPRSTKAVPRRIGPADANSPRPSFSSSASGRMAAVGQTLPQAMQLSWQPLVPARKFKTGVQSPSSPASSTSVTLDGAPWRTGKLATGDYFIRPESAPEQERRLIAENSADSIRIASSASWTESPAAGARAVLEVRLQKPVIDPDLCIGCGVCQHECPVSGLRAIRVTAENESRTRRHSLTPRAG